MAELLTFWEVRTLMTDALQVVNDIDDGASSELHTGLRRVRHHLHSALKSIDRATVPDPLRPGVAAPA